MINIVASSSCIRFQKVIRGPCILYRDPNRSQWYGAQATTRPWVAPTREKPLILEQDWPKSGIWGIFVETTTILPQKHVVSENFMSRDHIMNCCLFHLREFAQVLFLPWSKILTDLVEKYWPRVSETIFVRHNQRSVVCHGGFLCSWAAFGQIAF